MDDDLLSEFLTETREHLEGAETQLVQFERDPTDASLVSSMFRLVHTIKGTSSFLGLDRLQAVAHSAETLIGDLRDGAPPTEKTVSLILAAIDRIKTIVGDIERLGGEAEGSDADLIAELEANGAANLPAGGEASKRAAPKTPQADLLPEPAANTATAPAAGTGKLPASAAPSGAAPKAKPPAKKSHAKKKSAERAVPVQNGAERRGETIRVAVDTIERIMQLVSELVLNRNQLLEITRTLENDAIKPPLQRLSVLTTDLQDAVMRARMQPVGRLFSSLPRLVRELSGELHKKIDLITEGSDTELDRQLIEVLRDPLTHLVRNCADHGIETPKQRLAAGKPETGEIRVSASHEAGQINIDISDDGRGLDLDRIRERAIANHLATEEQAQQMGVEELCRFIFAPGFSTAAKVTSVSGRGVGMDVVRSNIESIGGSVSLSTVAGRGCRFAMKIPLTLAIAPALVVRVGGQRFALPQHAVVEAVGLGSGSRHVIEKVQDAMVLRLRDEVIPVIDLSSILGLAHRSKRSLQPEFGKIDAQQRASALAHERSECVSARITPSDHDAEEQIVVIIRMGTQLFGARVDAVLDVQDIVVKPLNASLAHLKIFSGQTILGDGSVVLILDPGGIGVQLGIETSNEKKRDTAREGDAVSQRTRLVLFRAGDGPLKVLPLSLLARIEMVAPERIQKSDGRFLMLHQGKLMPLMPTWPIDAIGDKAHPVLVITASNHTIGLLVEEIIDIVEGTLDVQLPSLSDEMVGWAQIDGNAVELLDVTYYLQAAYSSVFQQEAKTILLVEDDIFFRDTLRPMLASAGYAVTVASSAPLARELLELRRDFAAVLIDAGMETPDGRNLAQHLRETAIDARLPVLRLHEMPSHAVLGLAGEDRTTRNLSKLDRQTLLGTLASMLAAQAANGTSKDLAA